MNVSYYVYAVTEDRPELGKLLTAYRWDKLVFNPEDGDVASIWKAESCIIKAAASLRLHMQLPTHKYEQEGRSRVLVRFAVPPSKLARPFTNESRLLLPHERMVFETAALAAHRGKTSPAFALT